MKSWDCSMGLCDIIYAITDTIESIADMLPIENIEYDIFDNQIAWFLHMPNEVSCRTPYYKFSELPALLRGEKPCTGMDTLQRFCDRMLIEYRKR